VVAALVLALALVAAGGMLAVRPYMRAASLVVRSAGIEQAHPAVASWYRQRFSERDAAVASRDGALRARAYVPDRPGPQAVLLVPGVHAMGIGEPRLIQFARQLAATGLTVVTPELPDLKRYAVTPRSTDLIEDAVRWLTDDPGLCPGGRVGLIGISFAGGLSVVAAGRPSIADRLAFVVAFGGHGDFQRVVRYLCTGLEPDPAGLDSRRAADGSPAPRPPSIHRPPHDYGVAVMALDLAGQIVPADQVAPLQQGILVFLEASHLALYDTDSAAREFARARALEVTLHEPAATYLHLVNTRDVEALGARLLPVVAALGDDQALSPERSPAPHAPVFLLHGSDDNVIPAVESRFLARHLEGKVPVRLLLSPLITHAEVNRDASWSDVWQLIAFWASVSRR
jgi:dienelactone hydrolase